jgi:PfaB family protein
MREPIAIVGLSCLFPGARTPAAFWHNLIHGIDSTRDATAAEFRADPAVYYDPTRTRPDTTYSLRGGYVNADRLAEGTPDTLAESALDKAASWSLYTAREALRDARVSDAARGRCGLILGALQFPTEASHAAIAPLYDRALEAAIGRVLGDDAFRLLRPMTPRQAAAFEPPAAAVARLLGLGGPHFTLDAACASSVYAVGLACAYLSAGQADFMLAGAVSAADPLFVTMGFTHFGAYPHHGQSRPLDARSDGLLSGEGAGVLVLRRWADAVRDGDRVYAVIGGVGLSNDGRGKHPLTPNSAGQVLALQRAYAHLDPRTVQYVECHASGTPLGDTTELHSMDTFFGPLGTAPKIGLVKPNHGHLLTAAALSSTLKIILAMAHGEIPATLGVEQPLTSAVFGPGQIVRENTPWPVAEAGVRVAGVNAFGFGGVSAHLALVEPAAAPAPTQAGAPPVPPRLALIGMDAHFGPCESLAALSESAYAGKQHFRPLPPKRWKGLAASGSQGEAGSHDETAPPGAYIEQFEIDFLRFKFPPREDDQPTPQHLLLLRVADGAVRDAGLREGANVAVIVATGTELSLHQYRDRLDLSWQMGESLRAAGYDVESPAAAALETVVKDAISPPAQLNQYMSYIGNIVSSRVSALWNFSGPAFTLTAGEGTAARAVEIAQLLLADPALEAVVIGAVDLAGGAESTRAHDTAPARGPLTLSLDAAAQGAPLGEGAAAIVVCRAADANGHIYAHIDGVAIGAHADAAAVIARALRAAGTAPEAIGYLEVSASGAAPLDDAEIAGVTAAYRAPTDAPRTPTLAIGGVSAIVGHTGATAGLAGLVHAALALHGRFIPAVPGWTGPKWPERWAGGRFYAAAESRPWFQPDDGARRAGVNAVSRDGTFAHIVLSGIPDSQRAARSPAPVRGAAFAFDAPALFALSADAESGLMAALDGLEADAEALGDAPGALAALAARWYAARAEGRYAAALVARDRDGLLREIALARRGIPAAFAQEAAGRAGEWLTPAGSAFTTAPQGRAGKIAFVYPGGFNSYPYVGLDWLHLFPETHDHLVTLNRDVGGQISETLIYPRWLHTPTRAEVRAHRAGLSDDQRAMIGSGTVVAVMHTHTVRRLFGIEPHAAFGYSMGEGSMFWAMDVWRDSDAANRVFRASPLFQTRLFGPKEAVREAWGLGPEAGSDFWASFVLTASAAEVLPALEAEAHVYLTHINTPGELVIAGEPTACQRVIDRLGCGSIRAPFDVVIHNEAIMGEYGEFHRLHHWPMNADAAAKTAGITFYSAADYRPTALESGLLARNIARCSCKVVDFPRSVRRAHHDGVRVFIELGPGSTCTRWISDTLRADGLEGVAVNADHLRFDDAATVVKMAARLFSHRMPMQLDALFAPAPAAEPMRARLMRTITLGGEPVGDVIASAENRARFAAFAAQRAAPAGQPLPLAAASAPEPAVAGGYSAMIQARTAGLRALAAQFATGGSRADAAVADLVSAPTAAVSFHPRHTPTVPAAPPRPPAPAARFAPSPAVFSTERIDQFARGSIKACFGPEYAVYDDRRAPRIPNTDLMLVSRIVAVDAERIVTRPGSAMTAEYDVPPEMWFYRDNPSPFTPYSVLMEMALQPCGFLSAFMGPTLSFPEIDFYFRNLDGQGVLHHEPDLRGRTLVNRVVLLSSTVLQGIIIQKYSFDMQLDGASFYTGSSTFGYFTKQALSGQAGLDTGLPPEKRPTIWHTTGGRALVPAPASRPLRGMPIEGSALRLPFGQLAFVDEVRLDMNGGKHGHGYAYAVGTITPESWFLACHFHQDPVMPGSLGLETIFQAMEAFAIRADLGARWRRPRFALVPGEVVWKYRGQVLGESGRVEVEVHITRVEHDGDETRVFADANLWRGGARIYEFRNVALRVTG